MKKFVLSLLTTLVLCGSCLGSDALDEVNALRTRRGLRPFKRDTNLTLAAEYCCKYRAKNLIAGHVQLHYSDLHFIPRTKNGSFVYDVNKVVAGCAAWGRNPLNSVKNPGKYDWASCCTFENWQHAGAWEQIGSDGRRYMQLFVR